MDNPQKQFFCILKEIKLFNKYWEALHYIHKEYVLELIQNDDKLHMNSYRYISKVSKVCRESDEALDIIMEIFEILKESKKINQALMDSTYSATDKLIGKFEKMEVECNILIASIRGCKNHIRQEKLAKARIDNIKIAEGSQNHTKTRLARMLPKKDVILTDILWTVISLKRHFRTFNDIMENTAGELRIYVDNVYKINLRAEMVSVKKSALDFSDYYIETQADILISSMKPLKRYFIRIQAQISQHKATIGATLASKK